jgi:hypothetical protein
LSPSKFVPINGGMHHSIRFPPEVDEAINRTVEAQRQVNPRERPSFSSVVNDVLTGVVDDMVSEGHLCPVCLRTDCEEHVLEAQAVREEQDRRTYERLRLRFERKEETRGNHQERTRSH